MVLTTVYFERNWFSGIVKEKDLPMHLIVGLPDASSFVEAFGLALIETVECGKPVTIFNTSHHFNKVVNEDVGLLANTSIEDEET